MVVSRQTWRAYLSRLGTNHKVIIRVGNDNGKDAILEQWLDGQEVCEILVVTKRTLQTLRETGKIAYTMVKHKTYYRPKDVQFFLITLFKKRGL